MPSAHDGLNAVLKKVGWVMAFSLTAAVIKLIRAFREINRKFDAIDSKSSYFNHTKKSMRWKIHTVRFSPWTKDTLVIGLHSCNGKAGQVDELR